MQGRFMPTRCWAVMIKKFSTHYANPIDHRRKQKMVLFIDFAWLPNALGLMRLMGRQVFQRELS